MEKKEIVKMAYNLILGREPENDSVLDQEFVDVFDLRNRIMSSSEFKSILGENDYQCLKPHQIIGYSGCSEEDSILVSKFVDNGATSMEGYYTDFTGIRTSISALPGIQLRSGTINLNLPFPDDTFHAEAVEYVSLYYAIKQSMNKDIFTMFELGAGWGPWMAYTAKACLNKNFKHINIVGIEGEEKKIPIIKEHLSVNGLRADNDELCQTHKNIHSRIIHGVVTEKDCLVEFPVVDVMHYGASVLDTAHLKNEKKINVKGYSFKTLAKDFEVVDYLHMDIQGHEVDVIKSALTELHKKVRYMCIGTHSRKIEGDLLEILLDNGWELLREMPCIFAKGKLKKGFHLVDLITMDGTQLWRNLALQ